MRVRVPCLAVLLLAAAPAAAGELNSFEIDERTRWKPSECTKPIPPPVGAIGNPVERNRAVAGFNTYAKAVGAYLKCAVEEANQDGAAFRKIVNDSLEADQQELKTETEALKALIESGGRK